MKTAVIRLKSIDQLDHAPVVYLETSEGIARVVCPLSTWYGLELHAEVKVPEGDLEHPEVAAGIQWKF